MSEHPEFVGPPDEYIVSFRPGHGRSEEERIFESMSDIERVEYCDPLAHEFMARLMANEVGPECFPEGHHFEEAYTLSTQHGGLLFRGWQTEQPRLFGAISRICIEQMGCVGWMLVEKTKDTMKSV